MVVAGSGAQGTQDLRSSSASRNWREMTWTPMSNAARAATMPNTPRAMASGFTVRSTLASTGAMAWKDAVVPRRNQAGELPLHLGDAGVPAVDLQPVGDGAALTLARVGHDLPAQRGREEDERREPVDVVLHEGVAHLDEPDQLGVDPSMGRHLRRAEAGQPLLLLGVEPVGDHLTDVEPEQMRAADRRHDDLVGPIRVRPCGPR